MSKAQDDQSLDGQELQSGLVLLQRLPGAAGSVPICAYWRPQIWMT